MKWRRIEFPPGPDPDRSPDFEKHRPKIYILFVCNIGFVKRSFVFYSFVSPLFFRL